jgi:hypothetical protein
MISRDELISRLDPWMNRPLQGTGLPRPEQARPVRCANLGTYWA